MSTFFNSSEMVSIPGALLLLSCLNADLISSFDISSLVLPFSILIGQLAVPCFIPLLNAPPIFLYVHLLGKYVTVSVSHHTDVAAVLTTDFLGYFFFTMFPVLSLRRPLLPMVPQWRCISSFVFYTISSGSCSLSLSLLFRNTNWSSTSKFFLPMVTVTVESTYSSDCHLWLSLSMISLPGIVTIRNRSQKDRAFTLLYLFKKVWSSTKMTFGCHWHVQWNMMNYLTFMTSTPGLLVFHLKIAFHTSACLGFALSTWYFF